MKNGKEFDYDKKKPNFEGNTVKKTIGIIVPIAAIVALCVFVWVKFKSSKQMAKAAHTHRMEKAALSGRLKKSNEALRELKGQMKQQKKPITKNAESQVAEFADEPVCQHILAVCNDKSNPIKSTVPVSAYADIALTDAQNAQLKDAAMRHYGPLFGKLKHQHPELKEKDFLYCYLCLLGLDNSQIAVLTQLSYRTIWEREKRLQTLFHGNDRIAVILHEMMIH